MEDRLPRKLAAILYADVAGYSRLTGENEDAMHRTLSEYFDLISIAIESHHGQVKHYAGDAVLAQFDAIVDALSAAVVIQDELKKRNQDVSDERKVEFRIGVNLGDVIEERGVGPLTRSDPRTIKPPEGPDTCLFAPDAVLPCLLWVESCLLGNAYIGYP